jgi:GntR family transcriptional regulator
VRAVVPSRAEHEALELTPPAAAFSVFRTGTSAGVPVEWRHTLVRADRFALTGTLAAPPSGPGAGTGDVAPLALLPDIR